MNLTNAMNRRFYILWSLLFVLCFGTASAQNDAKSNLQQQAEAENEKGNVASTRYLYIRAFEDYTNKDQMQQGVECAAKAAALYYKENYYKEAFDLLRRVDQTIIGKKLSSSAAAALHYPPA